MSHFKTKMHKIRSLASVFVRLFHLSFRVSDEI